MICEKCGREAVVLMGGLCGDCRRAESKSDYPKTIMMSEIAALEEQLDKSRSIIATAQNREAQSFVEKVDSEIMNDDDVSNLIVEKESCMNCRFYRRRGLECRRHAPTCADNVHGRKFPTATDNGWCGDWES